MKLFKYIILCGLLEPYFFLANQNTKETEWKKQQYFWFKFQQVNNGYQFVDFNEAVGKTYFPLKKISTFKNCHEAYACFDEKIKNMLHKHGIDTDTPLEKRLAISKENKAPDYNTGTAEQFALVKKYINELGVDPESLTIIVDPSGEHNEDIFNERCGASVAIVPTNETENSQTFYYRFYAGNEFFKENPTTQKAIVCHEIDHIKHAYSLKQNKIDSRKLSHFEELTADASIFENKTSTSEEKYRQAHCLIKGISSAVRPTAVFNNPTSALWRNIVTRELLKKHLQQNPNLYIKAPVLSFALLLFNRSPYEYDFLKIALFKTLFASILVYGTYKLYKKIRFMHQTK